MFLIGCSSSSKPNVAEGRRLLEDLIRTESKGAMRLVSFPKTNGQALEVVGVKSYKLE
jgi:hypothetical protein